MCYYETILLMIFHCETWFRNVNNVASLRTLASLLDLLRMIKLGSNDDEYKKN